MRNILKELLKKTFLKCNWWENEAGSGLSEHKEMKSEPQLEIFEFEDSHWKLSSFSKSLKVETFSINSFFGRS